MMEVNEEGFLRVLYNDDSTEVMQDCPNDIYALELNKISVAMPEDERIFLIIMHVAMEEKKKDDNSNVMEKSIRRISAPRVVCVSRQVTYQELEVDILTNLKTMQAGYRYDYGRYEHTPLPPSPLFRLRLVERDEYLSDNVDHPLYTDTVEECLSMAQSHNIAAYPHLKLYVEWLDSSVDYLRETLLHEQYSDDVSVQSVRNLPQLASKTTVYDCLDLYLQNEQIGLDGPWECPNCRALQAGIMKKQTLWTLPEVMVIHLKRFRQSTSRRFKLTSMVEFPLEELDMSRFMTKPEDLDAEVRLRNGHYKKSSWFGIPKPRRPPGSQLDQLNTYSLFGVVNHHGKLNSGHYTAFCRHPSDGKWYLYDDLKVKTVADAAEVVTRDAYLLFYQRDPLNTYPEYYYDDYTAQMQHSAIPSYRSSPALRSRSHEDLVDVMKNGYNENGLDDDDDDDARHRADARDSRSSFTRTAQLYASLPRQPRRQPLVHAKANNSSSSSNGHQTVALLPAQHTMNGHSSSLAAANAAYGNHNNSVNNNRQTTEYYYERHRAVPLHVNGDGDGTAPPAAASAATKTPRLSTTRPVQESSV